MALSHLLRNVVPRPRLAGLLLSTARRSCGCRANGPPCWRCGGAVDRSVERYFCKCGVIQEPTPCSHFEAMALPQSFAVELELLRHQMRDLQQRLHPDRFTLKSKREQEFAAQHSTVVNKAFDVLSRPLERAVYLLRVLGIEIGEKEQHVQPEFLMTMMELNEVLAEEPSAEELEEVFRTVEKTIASYEQQVARAFDADDLESAADIVKYWRYYDNVLQKVKALRPVT